MARAGPPVDRDRLERPDQPHVLRHVRLPEALRLLAREGNAADAPGAQRGQGRRLERVAREGRARRSAPARARALGDDEAGLMDDQHRIEPAPDGGVRFFLPPAERELLLQLRAELLSLLTSAPDDPSLERLFPPAYDDRKQDSEYQRLMRDELETGLRETFDVMEATAGREELSAAEAEAWLRALTDLRLVLGTRLDVREDTFASGLDL